MPLDSSLKPSLATIVGTYALPFDSRKARASAPDSIMSCEEKSSLGSCCNSNRASPVATTSGRTSSIAAACRIGLLNAGGGTWEVEHDSRKASGQTDTESLVAARTRSPEALSLTTTVLRRCLGSMFDKTGR